MTADHIAEQHAALRAVKRGCWAALRELINAACLWVDTHPVTPDLLDQIHHDDAAVGGEGVPLVDPGSIAEFSALIGKPTRFGAGILGDALELRHRLPLLWARVQSLEVDPADACRVARRTRYLDPLAAGWVDTEVAPRVGRLSRAQLDRTIEEANARSGIVPDPVFDLYVDLVHDTLSVNGRSYLSAMLPLADGLELDQALVHGARLQKYWGSKASLDVRRAHALGELARGQVMLPGPIDRAPLDEELDGPVDRPDRIPAGRGHPDSTPNHPSTTRPVRANQLDMADWPDTSDPRGLTHPPDIGPPPCLADSTATDPPDGAHPVDGVDPLELSGGTQRVADEPANAVPRPPVPRRIVLNVILSAAALRAGAPDCAEPEGNRPGRQPVLGRLAELNAPITADEVRAWCGVPGASITIRPVIDLNAPERTSSYEPTARIREQVTLTNPTCVFPWCHVPSTRSDLDHIVPFRHADDAATADDHVHDEQALEDTTGNETATNPDQDCPSGAPANASGGPTSADNLAPLCRTHHRLKTFHRWRYVRLSAQDFLWISPAGERYLRRGPDTVETEPDGAASENRQIGENRPSGKLPGGDSADGKLRPHDDFGDHLRPAS